MRWQVGDEGSQAVGEGQGFLLGEMNLFPSGLRKVGMERDV